MKTKSNIVTIELTDDSLSDVHGGIDGIELPFTYSSGISPADWEQFCRDVEERNNKPPSFL